MSDPEGGGDGEHELGVGEGSLNLNNLPGSSESKMTEPEIVTPEKAVGESKFYNQHTVLYKGKASNHYNSLIYATILVVVFMVNVFTDFILASAYFERGLTLSAISLIFWHELAAVIEASLDWFSHGTFKKLPFHLLRVQIILDYYEYIQVWKTKKGKRWPTKDFYGGHSFNTFPFVFPSLMVQTYVLFSQGDFVPAVQIVSLALSAMHAFIDLSHYFKYVSLPREIHAAQMFKALFNTVIRTSVGAFLIAEFEGYVIFAMALSWFAGFGCYVLFVWISRHRKRDDPIKFKRMHLVQGVIVGVIMMFAAFPFAPNHACVDWWFGYLISDTKLNIENAFLLSIMLGTWAVYDTRKDLYYSVVFLACSSVIFNFVFLKLLDGAVRKYLAFRQVYSAQLIVRHFANWGKYYRDILRERNKRKHEREDADRL